MALTHVDDKNQPAMVDVTAKGALLRTATAEATVLLPDHVAKKLAADNWQTAKGPVFATAIIAGTMAAKKTSELIPFCHPLPLDGCTITIEPRAGSGGSCDDRSSGQQLKISCTVKAFYKTGVEMEALTGASVAALTLYDMLKALSHAIVVSDLRVTAKTKGDEHDSLKK